MPGRDGAIRMRPGMFLGIKFVCFDTLRIPFFVPTDLEAFHAQSDHPAFVPLPVFSDRAACCSDPAKERTTAATG